jgi:chromosomal replication initiation ATPase DnaA
MIRNLYAIPGLSRTKFCVHDNKAIQTTVELEVCEYINAHPELVITENRKLEVVTPEAIHSKSRKMEFVFARHMVVYVLCYYSSYTLKAIGLLYGGRDHTTVLHSRNTIENYLGPKGQANYREFIKNFLTTYRYEYQKYETVKTFRATT